MTETTHDRTIKWLSDYMKTHSEDRMSFKEVRRQMRAEGEYYISCYLLDNKFLYGTFVREAEKLRV